MTKPRRAKYEVLPAKSGEFRWKVTWDGQTLHLCNRKIAAVVVAAAHARNQLTYGQLSTLKIRGLNGRIQDERTYGKDPRKTRG